LIKITYILYLILIKKTTKAKNRKLNYHINLIYNFFTS